LDGAATLKVTNKESLSLIFDNQFFDVYECECGLYESVVFISVSVVFIIVSVVFMSVNVGFMNVSVSYEYECVCVC